MIKKLLPNGFESWHETHFMVVQHLVSTSEMPGGLTERTREDYGSGGLFELAKNLTDEFEEKYRGHEWAADYFDKIDEFLAEKEKSITL